MKEQIFNITRFFMFFVAILQLALSQIHIAVSTKIFDTTVGFYLFIYIMFGIIIAFNSVNLKRKTNIWFTTACCIAGALSGVKYLSILFNDLKSGNVVTMDNARWSIYLTFLAIATYLIGLVIIIVIKRKDI